MAYDREFRECRIAWKTIVVCPLLFSCVETHETWLEDNRYLNMTLLAEQKKEALRLAA